MNLEEKLRNEIISLIERLQAAIYGDIALELEREHGKIDHRNVRRIISALVKEKVICREVDYSRRKIFLKRCS